MQALWLENQQLQLRHDLPEPPLPEGEARIRVLQAGICNTDLELLRGYYPYRGVLGHEFVPEKCRHGR
ncbi:MAG: alcohol dehydrogenase catalytic domain-containing protein [Synechocystis sp.]